MDNDPNSSFRRFLDDQPAPVAPVERHVRERVQLIVGAARAAGVRAESAEIGHSREGRALYGVSLGKGDLRISITAGAHADEPGGPLAALAFADFLIRAPEGRSLLAESTWRICPHVNPDAAERNAAWFVDPPDLRKYLEHVVREPPGDDVEFNYPLEIHLSDSPTRSPPSAGTTGSPSVDIASDSAKSRGQIRPISPIGPISLPPSQSAPAGGEAEPPLPRPENIAVARFLSGGAPYHLHASLHGMGFAEGVWWLICREWVDRTAPLRAELAAVFRRLDLGVHDIDRKGAKGFHRIERGFSTTPTGTAMREFFRDQRQPDTARLFLASSMEYVQSLGGDPLAMVSEIPAFRIHGGGKIPDPPHEETPFTRVRSRLPAVRASLAESDTIPLDVLVRQFDIRPVPFRRQIEGVALGVLTAVDWLRQRPAPTAP